MLSLLAKAALLNLVDERVKAGGRRGPGKPGGWVGPGKEQVVEVSTRRKIRAEGKRYKGAIVRKNLRAAIYLRDNYQCRYCNIDTRKDRHGPTLDHYVPYSRTQNNRSSNLGCACRKCNCSRKNLPVAKFIATNPKKYAGAPERWKTRKQSIKQYRQQAKKEVDIKASDNLIERVSARLLLAGVDKRTKAGGKRGPGSPGGWTGKAIEKGPGDVVKQSEQWAEKLPLHKKILVQNWVRGEIAYEARQALINGPEDKYYTTATILLKTLKTAPTYRGDIYRGMIFSSETQVDNFLRGIKQSGLANNTLTSFSRRFDIAARFSGYARSKYEPKSGQSVRYAVVLHVRRGRGKAIEGAAKDVGEDYLEETEVVSMPGDRFRYVAHRDQQVTIDKGTGRRVDVYLEGDYRR